MIFLKTANHSFYMVAVRDGTSSVGRLIPALNLKPSWHRLKADFWIKVMALGADNSMIETFGPALSVIGESNLRQCLDVDNPSLQLILTQMYNRSDLTRRVKRRLTVHRPTLLIKRWHCWSMRLHAAAILSRSVDARCC